MASDDWRLRIELEHEEKHGLLGRLGLRESDAEELADELRDLKLAVTEEDGRCFVYAGSSLDLERARTLIEREFDELGLQPESMTTEHWLADEERWDGAAPTQDTTTSWSPRASRPGRSGSPRATTRRPSSSPTGSRPRATASSGAGAS